MSHDYLVCSVKSSLVMSGDYDLLSSPIGRLIRNVVITVTGDFAPVAGSSALFSLGTQSGGVKAHASLFCVRASMQENADGMKNQLEAQKQAVDQLLGNTR